MGGVRYTWMLNDYQKATDQMMSIVMRRAGAAVTCDVDPLMLVDSNTRRVES